MSRKNPEEGESDGCPVPVGVATRTIPPYEGVPIAPRRPSGGYRVLGHWGPPCGAIGAPPARHRGAIGGAIVPRPRGNWDPPKFPMDTNFHADMSIK